MNFWPILIALGLAYLLQTALAFSQMRSFTAAYRILRRQGLVAIGTKKGLFRSGAIVMHCVDDAGDIIDSKKISGVTVFAKFQTLPGFVGKNIRSISADDCRHMPRSVRKATDNARDNYVTIMAGGTIAEREAPLDALATKTKSLFKKITKRKD
jgi:DNA-binding transcriptional regulator of glucitol operon